MSAPVIRVSAAVVIDGAGRALVVRKRGAVVFQQPGGKPDPGETALEAVVREVAEEITVELSPAAFEPLGEYSATAANEPDHVVVADAFRVRINAEDARANAEIVEMRWLHQDDVPHTPLAPLSRTHLIRHAWTPEAKNSA